LIFYYNMFLNAYVKIYMLP